MVTGIRRLELAWLAGMPALITLLLAVFSLSSLHVASGLNHFMPILPLIPVYYWGITRAREMPYAFVLMLGLVGDAVSGTPLGLSSLLYILFLMRVRALRKYIHKDGFLVQWGYFGLYLGVLALANWGLLSLLYGRLAAIFPALIQWVLTVGCYPFLHNLLDRLYDHITARRRQLQQGR